MSNSKYNYQYYDYTKKGYLSFQTKKVGALINEGKFNLAKNILKDVLEKYPLDIIALKQWAQILVFERNYLEAMEILESLPVEKCYMNLAAVYQKLGYWDKIKDLYEKFYRKVDKNNCHRYGYKQQRIYFSSMFDNCCPSYPNFSYFDLQLYKYSSDFALEHIKEGHDGSNLNKSSFAQEIDVEELYYKVKDYIKAHPEKGIINDCMLENFMFYLAECGTGIDKSLYDTFVVKTIINSDFIITMYPQKSDIINYDICRIDDYKEKNPVKVKKGIERFNSRYKI